MERVNGTRYTTEDLLEAITYAHNWVGFPIGSLSKEQYREVAMRVKISLPGANTISARFGSWRRALDAHMRHEWRLQAAAYKAVVVV